MSPNGPATRADGAVAAARAGERLHTILVVSSHEESDRLLSSALEGLRVCLVRADAQAPFPISTESRFVAIVDLASPDTAALRTVSALKNAGYTVLCVARGADSWAIGRTCQALVAGAARLLDTSARGFAGALRDVLAQTFANAARRTDENRRLCRLMSGLGIEGISESALSTYRWVLRVSALSDLPTLIAGETGTGKELLARAMHALDPKRREGPFIPVNCGAIPTTIAESELFGHRRGAFTGAERDRLGLIRSAHGGILFLDEISELEAPLQVKLLRVLQEGRVSAVGEDRDTQVDVRVIAATNRDLHEQVLADRFREDLYYRLSVLSVSVAPLRHRPDDVAVLVGHFIRKYADLAPVRHVVASDCFVRALVQTGLPGNARQVENLVRYAIVAKDDDSPLDVRDLPAELWAELAHKSGCAAGVDVETADAELEPRLADREVTLSASREIPHPHERATADDLIPRRVLSAHDWSLSRSLEYCERAFMQTALDVSQGNRSQTARLLGITVRSVYNKVQKYQLRD